MKTLNLTPIAVLACSLLITSKVHAEDSEAKREPAAATYPKAEEEKKSESSFKFGGFFDFGYNFFAAPEDSSVTNPNAESGYTLDDAAIYFNYDKDKLSVVADLPFRRAYDSDSDSSATIPNQSSKNNITFGAEKAQLYLRYKITPNLVWQFGQFVALYGAEAGDSKDRMFSHGGVVGANFLPATHNGAMLEYTYENIMIKLVAANPNNQGSNGSSANLDDKSEFGATFGFSNDNVHGQVGYLSRQILKADSSELKNRTLSEVLLGFNLGQFSVDFEYDLLNDPTKNTLTPADNSDNEDAANGYMVLASYNFNENTTVAVRNESVQNDPTAASTKSTKSLGVSIKHRVTDEFELRTDYVSYEYEPMSGAKYQNRRFNIGAIVSF